jgi:hypothetical protein
MIRNIALCLALSFGSLACVSDVDGIAADGDGNDGEGVTPDNVSASTIDIGFDGFADQFGFYSDFYDIDKSHTHLCHGYFSWDVGSQQPHSGDASDQSSREYLDTWLAAAAGHCAEALISFKSMTNRAAIDEADFTTAFDNFVSTDWKTETGFSGTFVFSTWNEPNNPATAGNGLGVQIEANLAARYYMAATKLCRSHDCKVVAGDFATNGNMWDDLEWNCANDNVPLDELCSEFSSENPTHKPASYLDKYKNEIAQHRNDAAYGLGGAFHPMYFAYHGWHDTNEYLAAGAHCDSYNDCAARRLEKSLGGMWAATDIWDTEDGMGQNGALSDHDQACGAAFLLRLATLTDRVKRVYITRLSGGDDELITGSDARPALGVLANREKTYAADCK